MIVSLDDVIAALDRGRSASRDTAAGEALAIAFVPGPRKVKESVTFHTSAGGLLVVDLDEQGRALSVEIV